MQIQQINNNNKSMADPAVKAQNICSKLSQKVVEVKSFYNKHFPTDRRTYNLRVPLVGLILSVLTIHFVTNFFMVRRYFRHEDTDNLVKYLLIFISAALGYELYYGLLIGDRKQFTPWILGKLIELCFTFATIIYIIVDYWSILRFCVPQLCYGLIVFALNGLVTYVVTSTSLRQFRGHGRKTDIPEENIYEAYDDA
ncbi:uncharacterized protein LOC135137609 [Zophobas morio]|uniref:uncharacterized protein LOC135137609 n=1 Tax=Zophobas morio TaxID=2755281 RepID=UPI0030831644